METIDSVIVELEQINKKLTLVDSDISLRQRQVEELKQANARLLEMSLGKERRPSSLTTQRQKILVVQNHIDELLYLKQSLQAQREQVEKRLRLTQQKQEIERYKQLESDYLTALTQTSTALSTFLNHMQTLSQQQHPITRLLRLCSELGGREGLAEHGLNLPLIAARFREAANWMEADFSDNLTAVSVDTRNLLAQLEAAIAGKRAYHRIEPQKTTKQQVIPDQSMRAMGQYKILQKHENELAEQKSALQSFRGRRVIVRQKSE